METPCPSNTAHNANAEMIITRCHRCHHITAHASQHGWFTNIFTCRQCTHDMQSCRDDGCAQQSLVWRWTCWACGYPGNRAYDDPECGGGGGGSGEDDDDDTVCGYAAADGGNVWGWGKVKIWGQKTGNPEVERFLRAYVE
ncbi:hypothetical protein EX30DRAFT_120737 [Ascodesmis nigricans]|uniref:Uncharacterized protein n=1 Tax=Ascodesmis nigricans TaxID=341454 RepID=A0A4S2MSJ5_9PEZI|nr:hypothetical protein EX30DRAFT_120737 [Ascodesmis nigricans]